MLIAICSDSHDNLVNIQTFLDYCEKNKVETIIHCGDITTKETQQMFVDNFGGQIFFADGNADIHKQIEHKKTNRFQKIKRAPVPFIEFAADNIKIAACHKKDKAFRLANSNNYNLVFYGHTHKPWQDKINKTYVINPGTLAGMFMRATFAVYDTAMKKLELIVLDEMTGEKFQ